MNIFTESANLIADKLNSKADVLTFSPVFGCNDELLSCIYEAMQGRLLVLLPHTPNSVYRKQCRRNDVFFLGNNLQDEEIRQSLLATRKNKKCILFASLSIVQYDFFVQFVNTTEFEAIVLPYAERISPVVYQFDKRLFAIRELRAQLKKQLPICAFCASDASCILRDVTASLALKTPARVYPGICSKAATVHTDNGTPSFAALENHFRAGPYNKAVVLCASRQLAEDAYRYFRFFGYKCAVAHGGLHHEPRTRALERYIRGDADLLFTTSFAQAPFCTQEHLVAMLGIPVDLYSMQDLLCSSRDAAVFFTKEDLVQQLYGIEEDNEVRSRYSAMPQELLRQERLYLHRLLQDALQHNTPPAKVFATLWPHIYYTAGQPAETKEEKDVL